MENRVSFEKVKCVVFDFDGVFTDNRVIVNENGMEAVLCNRSDGIGLGRVRKLGISMFVLSTETNPVVSKRCEKLHLECIQGCVEKHQTLEILLKERCISPEETLFLGNDVNDLECLKMVGFPVVVADAYPEVKEVACWITNRNGGDGAVRELCDLVAEDKIRSYSVRSSTINPT
ncbi:MAG: HAD hydrolase family protein [SAR324 cluster bacterium]|nr:HAD hydrolase family protein [SAR324 cluster bacterium]